MKNSTLVSVLTLSSLVCLSGGCNSGEERNVSLKEVRQETDEAVRASMKYVQQSKDERVKALDRELSEMKQELVQLRTEAKLKLSSEMDQMISNLEQRQNEFEKSMKAFQNETDSAWQETAAKLDNAMGELRQGYARAFNELGIPQNIASKDGKDSEQMSDARPSDEAQAQPSK